VAIRTSRLSSCRIAKKKMWMRIKDSFIEAVSYEVLFSLLRLFGQRRLFNMLTIRCIDHWCRKLQNMTVLLQRMRLALSLWPSFSCSTVP